ncbi:MAG TPA: hypothetical protein VLO00_09230 [Cryobacterium sp.]|nr:hypothetical protein [Cryobacterium sp.]
MNGFIRHSSAAHGHDRSAVRGPARSAPTRNRLASAAKAGAIGALMLALAGCAGVPANGGSPATPTTGAPATSTPTAATVACPESASQGPWGDVIAAEQITDAFGVYCRTTLDPGSAAAPFDAGTVDLESLEMYGFTLGEAEAAQETALLYVAEQGLDSSRLDDYSTTDTAWFETVQGSFTPAAQDYFSPLVESSGLRDSGVIMTQSLPSPLRRDGGPRATRTELGVDRIFAVPGLDQQTALLVVGTTFSTAYSATDASIVEAAIRDERGTSSLTEAGLRTSTPTLFDGSDDEGLVLTGVFNVAFGAGEMRRLEYVSTAWVLATGDRNLQVDAFEPEVEPSLRPPLTGYPAN